MSATSEIRNVILVGATGNVGSLLIAPLAANFNLTILSRSSSTSKPTNANNVKTLRADYTLEGLTKAFTGQDAVVSTVGAVAFGEQKVMIDAAVAAGVKRFLPSEMSMNGDAKAVRDLVPVFKTKHEVLEYLKSKEAKGLTWTGLGTGPLFDWGLKAGFLDFDISKRHVTLWDKGDTRYSAITVADLGNAVVGVLQHPSETANRYVFAHSVTASQREVLNVLEGQTRQKWNVEPVTTEDEVAKAQKALATGDYAAAVRLAQATAFSNLPNMQQDFDADEKDRVVNDLLGIEMKSVAAVVEEVLTSERQHDA
ncbi:uncharacterized protein AB675_10071 [Cyphellophora attinorum]|uniref:NmrA-like domain-containing protein n=1 Tax=Cyphellophora attinorum TaxID=1664694 RepID=A0A0N1H654_9EURO|nr:uncharacterized protein AB675_10071 [Phialophora attinorum]KPI36717.1 hypothetical protein AB675_10071 [Phialophora attinorum]